MNEDKLNINWYPGHMAKAKKEIQSVIKQIDIVLEVIDSRIPNSSKVKDIDELTHNKQRIMVFSKYDLCDKEETNKWKEYYIKKGYEVVCVNLKDNNDYKEIIRSINSKMTTVNNKRKNKGLLPKKAKVLVLGVPNAGKSTLINKISGKNKVNVENKPGVTKSLSWIKINNNIDLMDTPGILMPKLDSEEEALNLASIGSIKETILPVEKVAFHILNKLNLYYKDKLKEYYNIINFDINNVIEMYETIEKYRNINKIQGETDYEKINTLILNDIKNERIKEITFDKM